MALCSQMVTSSRNTISRIQLVSLCLQSVALTRKCNDGLLYSYEKPNKTLTGSTDRVVFQAPGSGQEFADDTYLADKIDWPLSS